MTSGQVLPMLMDKCPLPYVKISPKQDVTLKCHFDTNAWTTDPYKKCPKTIVAKTIVQITNPSNK